MPDYAVYHEQTFDKEVAPKPLLRSVLIVQTSSIIFLPKTADLIHLNKKQNKNIPYGSCLHPEVCF